ncbi:PQQ-binding-like beta-propeller repeat protein [Actinoplanes utahensis]|uniref:Pyrrolo-quinoline quinone repeat domain-containing protein n=1 Tax=Actinoplanes utahensis TaxID=1869 RepID=A0A0A6UFE9_ACTUT|nr:PQQ-binding-like beta-propeller repeat protein [Actinoplanes utahensis]KHD73044.1 hypothetical protein MB27_35950 [Actinoplanes utahensis]KHD74767.1 hypothetical protein MB27_27050 [Actinoplanes utahensis]GIF34349.1 hypothetical protein Aut01nite_73350 [Actinoplanes utahensis]
MGADAANGPVVVIELGLDRGEPETYHRPGRRTTPLWLAPALLAVLSLFAVTGSAPPPGPPMEVLLRVAIGPGDPFVTHGDQLIVQAAGELASFDLRTGTQQWRVEQRIPVSRLRTGGGGVVLLRPWTPVRVEPGTTAVALSTGRVRWRNDRNVLQFADGGGADTLMVAVDGVRSASGAGRRVERAVEVVDPESGAARWRVWVPSTAVLLGLPGHEPDEARIVLVHADAIARLYDVASGALLAERRVPAADYAPENTVPAGGMMLLRHPGPSGIELSAYDARTLRPRWTVPAPTAREVMACGGLACLIGLDGVRVIDPATGDVLWHRPGWRSVEPAGAHLVAYADGPAAPSALVDPATGAVLVDLTGWRTVSGSAAAGRLLVVRDGGPEARSMVAVAAPGMSRPHPLADLPSGTGDCQAVPARLICRSVYGEVVVWAYRAPAG